MLNLEKESIKLIFRNQSIDLNNLDSYINTKTLILFYGRECYHYIKCDELNCFIFDDKYEKNI